MCSDHTSYGNHRLRGAAGARLRFGYDRLSAPKSAARNRRFPMPLGFPGPLDASSIGCDRRRISPVLASGGMIASQHPLVSSAGLRVLADGCNAVDAAVAAALVGTVVLPS